MLGSFYKWLMSWTRLFGMLRNYQEIFRFRQDCTPGMAHHKNNIHTYQLIYYRPSSFTFSRICYLEEVFSLLHIFHFAPFFFIVTRDISIQSLIQELIHSLSEDTYLNSEETRLHWKLVGEAGHTGSVTGLNNFSTAGKKISTSWRAKSHFPTGCALFQTQVAHGFSKDQSSSETSHRHYLLINEPLIFSVSCWLPKMLCVGTAAKLDTPVQRWGAGLHEAGASKSCESSFSHHTPHSWVAGCWSGYLPSY